MVRWNISMIRSAALAALLLYGTTQAGETANSPLAGYLEDWQACALVLRRDRHQEKSLEHGRDQCRLPLSPCSTFKIPNALIGLQTGAVSGPDDQKAWDGRQRSREDLNQDHTLDSAIKISAVWYFQELARDVGEDQMAYWLDQLDYGNQDISGGIDRFWLGSSLLIDAHQQLDLLKRLKHGTLPFKPVYQEQLRQMLEQDTDLDGRLFGKTGSCLGDETTGRPSHGWFVGWFDSGTQARPVTTWFVINIRGDEAWGLEARRIALEILKDHQ
jgi:beta-lactamase class D